MKKVFMFLGVLLVIMSIFQLNYSNAGKLPGIITWTSYDVGSSGYVQAAAIGDALMRKANVKLRVIPAGTDIGRITPLKSGMVDFSLTGIGSHFAWRGILDFASYTWGPQKLRQIWQVLPYGMSLVTAADANIKTPADVKGKRVAYIPGAPALNTSVEGFLAFANLTWDDVKKVLFGSYGAALKGLVEGKVDAEFTTGTASRLHELESSPRGIYWPPFPCSDKEGWKRLQKVAPYFGCDIIKTAVGLKKPTELPNYPYPTLVTYEKQSEEFVYNLTKAIYENYDFYKKIHPSMKGWEMKRAIRPPGMVPFHEGAVKFFKEIGAWTEGLEKYNKQTIEKEKARIAAWEKSKEKAIEDKISAKKFKGIWMKAEKAITTQ